MSSTTITCTTSTTSLTLGDSLTIQGKISQPVSGATVTLTYTRPDATTITRTTTTNSTGGYRTSFTPDRAGSWSVYASWSGNDQYLGATSATSTFSVSETYDWPMFHRFQNHTGYTTSPGPTSNNTLWTYNTGQNIYYSSPAISGGLIYFGTGYYVYCFNETTGTLKWRAYTDWISQYSSPAIASGRLYIGGSWRVFCLDASTGSQLWTYSTGGSVYSSPTVASGRVYFGSYDDKKVYCLDAITGQKIWEHTTGGYVQSSPAVVSGYLYIGSQDGYLYCLNASTGERVWKSQSFMSYIYYSSPAVANGSVFIGSDYGVYCFNAITGAYKWKYPTTWNLWCPYSSPAVANGRIYIGGSSYLYCLNATDGNHVLWYQNLIGSVYSPAVASGYVYASSYSPGRIYCLNATTGRHAWNYSITGDYMYSSPAIAGGRAYIGTYYGTVYCFGTLGSALNLVTKDSSGNILPLCNVTVADIGTAISDANGWVSFSGVSSGTYVVTTRWQGNTVNQTTITAPMLRISTDIKCQVYSTSFLNSFKDSNGKLLSRVTSFKLICPNGTTTTTPMGLHRLQNGTYRMKDIYFFDMNVTPSSLPSFNPASGPPTNVACNIAQTFIGGYVTTNTTWTSANSPYIVTSTIVIPSGYRLTIQPGTIVCFNGSYSITVFGALVAQGNVTNSVRLTSNKGTPAAGDWDKIHFKDASSDRECSVQYTIIEYASYGVYTESAAPFLIFNNTFQRNRYYSLYMNPSWSSLSSNVTRNTFRWNTQSDYVVYLYAYLGGDFSNNLITNNTCSYGVYLYYYRGNCNNNTITRNTCSSYAVYMGYSYYPYSFNNNNITRNTGNGLYVGGSSSATMTYNIIENNIGYGVYGEGSTTFKYNSIRYNSIGVYASQFPFHYCNVYGNTQYDARVSGTYGVDASNNWWGTTSSTTISQHIYDFWDDLNLGTLSYTPVLTSPVILASEQARLAINIRITDHLGNVLTPCTVNIATIGSRTTDANGWANFTGLLSGNYTVTVSWRGAIVEGTFISVLFSNVTRDVRCWILTETEWPMFHRFQNHTGYTSSPGPSTNNTLWTYSMYSRSSPVISSGYVYVGDDNGKVYSFNAYTGEKVWEYSTGSYIYSAPAVAFGRVYVTAYNGKVYCLNASTGVRLWSYDTSLEYSSYVYSSPTISYGRIYVGTNNGLFCLNASTGTLKWRYSSWMQYSSPAVADGRVYAGSSTIYCFDAFTGATLWSRYLYSDDYSSPTVSDGRIYIGLYNGKVYCLDASTGVQIWNYTAGSYIYYSSPAVALGRVFVGSDDDKLYCLNATTGAYLWNYTTDNDIRSSPAVAGEAVFVVSTSGTFYHLNAMTGSKIWNYRSYNWMDRSSFAVVGSRAYIATSGGLYCFGVPTSYSLSVRTKDWAGNILPSCTIYLGNIASTTSNVLGWANFTNIYSGTYRLNVYWRGSKVSETQMHVSDTDVTMDLACRVWHLTLYLRDADGTLLQANPSLYMTLPNRTRVTTSGLNTMVYRLMNGSFYFAVKWQNNWVYGNTSKSLDPSTTSLNLTCKVYTISFTTQDNSGTTTLNATQIILRCPNATDVAISTLTGLKLQNGTLTIKRIVWQGSNVIPTPNPTHSLTSSYEWIIRCRVYATDFTATFRDHTGRTLSPQVTSFSLLCPNSTSKLNIPLASHFLQNGTYTWISVLWQNITYYPTGTFDPSLGGPVVNLFRRDYIVTPDPVNRPTFQPMVSTVSNSSISQLTFSLGLRMMNLTIAGPSGTRGFINITMPLRLLFPPFTIHIDGRNVSYTLTFNQTHAFVYTWCNHSVHILQLTGSIVYTNLRTLDRDLNPLPFISVRIINVENLTTNTAGWANLTNVVPGTYLVNAYWHGSKVNQTTITTSFQNMTILIKCGVWNLNIQLKDSSDNLLPPRTTQLFCNLPNATTLTFSYVNTATFKTMNGTFFFTVKWQGSWIYGNTSTVLDANATISILCKVYTLSLTFMDNSGAYSVTPSQVSILCPNGTTKTLVAYTGLKAQNGTWAVKQVVWRGSNVVPSPNPSKTMTTNIAWIINCRIYSTAWSFKDNSGSTTLTSVARLTFICPNGTRKVLTTYSGIYLQNGTFTVTEISWQGNNVKQTSQTFDPTNTPVSLKCRVYIIGFSSSFKDSSGTILYAPPSSFKLTFPNGTTSTLLTPKSYLIQNGTTAWSSIIWQGTEVKPTVATFDATNGNPTVKVRVYALRMRMRDNLGNALTNSIDLVFPNASTLTDQPTKGWLNFSQVQIGTVNMSTSLTVSTFERYVLLNATSISLSVDTTIDAQVWRHDFKVTLGFKDNSGNYVLSAPSNFTVLMQNGTSTRSPSSNTWMPTGTTTLTSITWQASNVRPQIAPVVIISSATTYYYNVSVYYTRFLSSQFRDRSGVMLYTPPASFKLIYPNGTASGALIVDSSFLIQNGTTKVASIVWQGSEVVFPNFYWGNYPFNMSQVQAPIITCQVYSLSFVFKDFEGKFTVNPTEIIVQAPNGTEATLSSFNIPQAQCGVWTVKEVRFKGCNIAPEPSPTCDLEKSYTWSINTEVCSLQVTVADPIGIRIPGAIVELLMNEKTFETGKTDSSGNVIFAVPRASYQVKSTYMGLTQLQTVDTTKTMTVRLVSLLSQAMLVIIVAPPTAAVSSVFAIRNSRAKARRRYAIQQLRLGRTELSALKKAFPDKTIREALNSMGGEGLLVEGKVFITNIWLEKTIVNSGVATIQRMAEDLNIPPTYLEEPMRKLVEAKRVLPSNGNYVHVGWLRSQISERLKTFGRISAKEFAEKYSLTAPLVVDEFISISNEYPDKYVLARGDELVTTDVLNTILLDYIKRR